MSALLMPRLQEPRDDVARLIAAKGARGATIGELAEALALPPTVVEWLLRRLLILGDIQTADHTPVGYPPHYVLREVAGSTTREELTV